MTTSGGVKCWGANWYGQLGDGTTTPRSTPVDVIGLTSGVVGVATGAYHTCALMASGGGKCWGWNGLGQLGDGTDTHRSTPVDVIGLTSSLAVLTAGAYHTCAVTVNGGVKCWGGNGESQLGNGMGGIGSHTPVDVIGLTSGVVGAATGSSHTCALTTSGGVKCWGANWYGQLGDGTTTQRNIPVDVSGLTSGIMAVAPGSYHTCALTTSGGVKCWGGNDDGQLGDRTMTQRLTPVDVVASIPHFSLTHHSGQPGSFFTVTGENFPTSSQAIVTINGTVLTTTLPVNGMGNFVAILNTTSADAGFYDVVVSVELSVSATDVFLLDVHAPLHAQEGSGVVLFVPAGIAVEPQRVYLPIIQR